MTTYWIYDHEWARIRNVMNRRFRRGPCELCNSERINMVGYSIKTGKVRCFKCFDAEVEEIRKSDARYRANFDAFNAKVASGGRVSAIARIRQRTHVRGF
jgi:hypothetical protein